MNAKRSTKTGSTFAVLGSLLCSLALFFYLEFMNYSVADSLRVWKAVQEVMSNIVDTHFQIAFGFDGSKPWRAEYWIVLLYILTAGEISPPWGTEIHQIRNNVVIFEDIFLYKHSNKTSSLGEYCVLFLSPEPLQLWLNLASNLVSWFCASTKVRIKSHAKMPCCLATTSTDLSQGTPKLAHGAAKIRVPPLTRRRAFLAWLLKA